MRLRGAVACVSSSRLSFILCLGAQGCCKYGVEKGFFVFAYSRAFRAGHPRVRCPYQDRGCDGLGSCGRVPTWWNPRGAQLQSRRGLEAPPRACRRAVPWLLDSRGRGQLARAGGLFEMSVCFGDQETMKAAARVSVVSGLFIAKGTNASITNKRH
jgi:hypothetical protein